MRAEKISQLTPVKFPVGCTEKARQSVNVCRPATNDRGLERERKHTVPLGAMLGIVPFKVLKSEVASFWAVLLPRRFTKTLVSGRSARARQADCSPSAQGGGVASRRQGEEGCEKKKAERTRGWRFARSAGRPFGRAARKYQFIRDEHSQSGVAQQAARVCRCFLVSNNEASRGGRANPRNSPTQRRAGSYTSRIPAPSP